MEAKKVSKTIFFNYYYFVHTLLRKVRKTGETEVRVHRWGRSPAPAAGPQQPPRPPQCDWVLPDVGLEPVSPWSHCSGRRAAGAQGCIHLCTPEDRGREERLCWKDQCLCHKYKLRTNTMKKVSQPQKKMISFMDQWENWNRHTSWKKQTNNKTHSADWKRTKLKFIFFKRKQIQMEEIMMWKTLFESKMNWQPIIYMWSYLQW